MFIAIVGHVDNGKSSLLSRILHPDKCGDTGVLDFLEEEKETGNTYEYSTHETKEGDITFVDTAGHICFIRSNIKAYTTLPITAAVIVCSLRRGEFEAGFREKEERLSPLREQLILLRCSGVRRAFIVLTKVDLDMSLREEEEKVAAPLETFLKSIQMKCMNKISCSARDGTGIEDLLGYLRSLAPTRPLAPEKALNCPTFFKILFIPKGKVITAGTIFMAHFCGEEVPCALHEVKGEVKRGGKLAHLKSPILKLYGEYQVVLIFKKGAACAGGGRIILRMADTTVGYCN